jgi:hypothetical protein
MPFGPFQPRKPENRIFRRYALDGHGCILVWSLRAFDDAEVTFDLCPNSHKIVILSGAPTDESQETVLVRGVEEPGDACLTDTVRVFSTTEALPDLPAYVGADTE